MASNEVAFSDISQGPHTYTVVATDEDGLVDRSEVHFEGEGMGETLYRVDPVIQSGKMLSCFAHFNL